MKLSSMSIRRPVLATVMSFTILLFGIIAFTRLPVREYPDIDPPIISVTTYYRGASPAVVETEITNVLEEQFATLEGVKTLTSSDEHRDYTDAHLLADTARADNLIRGMDRYVAYIKRVRDEITIPAASSLPQ